MGSGSVPEGVRKGAGRVPEGFRKGSGRVPEGSWKDFKSGGVPVRF